MLLEQSIPLVDSERIRNCLSQLCASPGEFDLFFTEVFDQIDALSEQFLRKQKAWREQHDDADLELSRRMAHWEEQRAAIAAEREQLRESNEHSREAASIASDERIRQALEGIEQERATFRAALDETQKRAAELAELAADLARARQEICAAREAAQSDSSQIEAELNQQMIELRHDRQCLQQERTVLEVELESVRNRAAELTERLAEQKREFGEERAQWSEEIKRLRKTLESLSSRPAPVEAERGSVAVARESRPTPESSPEPDPVLDSVMAQFEMLQRDLARRRKQPAKAG